MCTNVYKKMPNVREYLNKRGEKLVPKFIG